MSMRRHILLAEHFRLMSLLLENREEAIAKKFLPLIIQKIPSMSFSDKKAVDRANPGALNALLEPGEWTDDQLLSMKEQFATHILDMIWKADPSSKKAYATWMLTRFVSMKSVENALTLEDLSRTRDYLSLYERVKNRLPTELKDINRFKSTNDLFDAIKDFRENDSGEVVSQDFEKKMYSESEVIYKGSDYEILIPKTMEASQYFGRGTEWCTAYAPPKTNNMFDSYNNRGPLFIVKQMSDGERWQFHVETNSYMDVNDRSINIRQFLQDHPKVNEVFNKYFNVHSWEVISELSPEYSLYFGSVGEGFGVRVDPPGTTYGGLIRERSTLDITTDKNRVIISASVHGGTDSNQTHDGLTKGLDALKITGNNEILFDEDLVWVKGQGWGRLADCPADVTETYNNGATLTASKIDFSDKEFVIYFKETDHDGKEDDLAVVYGTSTEFFFYKTYKRWGVSDEDGEFIADAVAKLVPENYIFDRDSSVHPLPGSATLIADRPQWLGIGAIYKAMGDTPLLRKKLTAWLAENDGHMAETEYEWIGDEVIVDRYKDIDELVDQEGSRSAKHIIKGDTYEFDQYIEPDDWAKDKMLTRLKKNEPKVFSKLIAYLKDEFELELADAEIELEDERDIMSLIAEVGDVGLDGPFASAYSDAAASGAQTDAFNALIESLKNPHLLYKNSDGWSPTPVWDVPVAIVADVKTILDNCTDIDDVEGNGLQQGGHGYFLKAFEAEIDPHESTYGWSGHDDELEAERFVELVKEILPKD